MRILMVLIFLKKHFYTHCKQIILHFFLKTKNLLELMKTFDIFSIFSGLKSNKSKYEIGGLGSLKGLK